MTAAWDHDWRRFVKEQLKAKGFASLTAYVRNNEGVPFEELAADLGGKKVAPVQVVELLREECKADDAMEYFMKTSLVRFLRFHAPNGVGMHGDWPLTLALSSWVSEMDKPMRGRCRQITKAIRKSFESHPADWLPMSFDDATIGQVFREHDEQQ